MARRLPARVGVQAWRIRVIQVSLSSSSFLTGKLFSARRVWGLSAAAQAQAQKVRSTAAALRIYAWQVCVRVGGTWGRFYIWTTYSPLTPDPSAIHRRCRKRRVGGGCRERDVQLIDDDRNSMTATRPAFPRFTWWSNSSLRIWPRITIPREGSRAPFSWQSFHISKRALASGAVFLLIHSSAPRSSSAPLRRLLTQVSRETPRRLSVGGCQ